jgi:hypothetical protein
LYASDSDIADDYYIDRSPYWVHSASTDNADWIFFVENDSEGTATGSLKVTSVATYDIQDGVEFTLLLELYEEKIYRYAPPMGVLSVAEYNVNDTFSAFACYVYSGDLSNGPYYHLPQLTLYGDYYAGRALLLQFFELTYPTVYYFLFSNNFGLTGAVTGTFTFTDIPVNTLTSGTAVNVDFPNSAQFQFPDVYGFQIYKLPGSAGQTGAIDIATTNSAGGFLTFWESSNGIIIGGAYGGDDSVSVTMTTDNNDFYVVPAAQGVSSSGTITVTQRPTITLQPGVASSFNFGYDNYRLARLPAASNTNGIVRVSVTGPYYYTCQTSNYGFPTSPDYSGDSIFYAEVDGQ